MWRPVEVRFVDYVSTMLERGYIPMLMRVLQVFDWGGYLLMLRIVRVCRVEEILREEICLSYSLTL